MVYREDQPAAVCSRCSERAELACPRCHAPYCEAHSPPAERRCDPCESEYLATETRKTRNAAIFPLVIAGVAGFIGVMAIHAARNGFITGPAAHFAAVILYGALGIMALSFAMPALIRRRLRRRFLSERRH